MANEDDHRVVTGAETENAPAVLSEPAPAAPGADATAEPDATASTTANEPAAPAPTAQDETAAATATPDAAQPEQPPAPAVPERVVIVTGAGSGLGYHVAKTLCDAGNDVIFAGKDEEQIKTAVAKIKEAKPEAVASYLQVFRVLFLNY